jgi:hypothetical protein
MSSTVPRLYNCLPHLVRSRSVDICHALSIDDYVAHIALTRKYMHAATPRLLTKPLYFPNMKYLM